MSDHTPDPLGDRLHDFDPGAPMSPMTPGEVRRRGDRLRRRNRVLTGVAAVAAVAVIATPLGLLAGNGSGSDPDPAPAPPDRTLGTGVLLDVGQVPTREGIREGLGPWQLSTDAADQPDSCLPLDGTGLDAASVATRAFGASFEIPDGATADPSSPSFGSFARETVLQYLDADAADAGFDAAVAADTACEGAEEVSAADPEPIDVEGGTGQVTQHLLPGACGDGCDGILFDRTAVLRIADDRVLLVSLAEYGGPVNPTAFQRSTRELVAAAVAKAAGEDVPEAGPPTTPQVPADFPLGEGINDDADGERSGPSPDAPEVAFPDGFCVPTPVGAPIDRLAFQQTGPEYLYGQELLLYASPRDAADVLEELRGAVADCATIPGDGAGNDVTLTVFESGVTQNSLTFGLGYEQGLGGGIYQATQVGDAVLVTVETGEYSPESLESGVTATTERNAPLVEAMCADFGGEC